MENGGGEDSKKERTTKSSSSYSAKSLGDCDYTNGSSKSKEQEQEEEEEEEGGGEKDSATPVYSREVTLQAHFTFGTPSMAPVQYAHVTPTSTSSLSGRPLMASGAPVEQWRWTGDGTAAGAQCSITCGREGLTMTYNAQPPPAAAAASSSKSICGIPLVPCTICDYLVAAHPDHHHMSTITTTTTSTSTSASAPGTLASLPIATTCFASSPSSPTFTQSLMDLSKPLEQQPSTGRSLTFSGSLDRATHRPMQQRPYGRRCKSTAHIILQNNELQAPKEMRPHEFHSTLREGEPPKQTEGEPRGRARHRVRPEGRFTGGNALGSFPPPPPPAPPSGGWERLRPVTEEQEHQQQARRSIFEGGDGMMPHHMPPCCPCHHCTALYSLMSSLAHERTCHACAAHHHQCHHHHHSPCSPSHTHGQGPPPMPQGVQGAPIHPCPHTQETTRGPSAKSPTITTFNSHKSYEEELGGPPRRQGGGGGGPHPPAPPPTGGGPSQRLAPPSDRQQSKPRTPSPGLHPRRGQSPESPESSPSPSPQRVGRAPGASAGDQSQTTPHLPRRVPRMGAAAAAAAAAASATGPSGYAAGQVLDHEFVL